MPDKSRMPPSSRTPFVKFYSIVIAVALFALGCAFSLRISFLQQRADISSLRDRVALEMDHIRTNLSRELYANINLKQGLVDLVRIQGQMQQSQFDAMARELIAHSKLIRNVALAPGNVIRFIYPLRGNEKAVGLDYLKTPDQAEAVLRAIAEKKMVIAGPLKLVQGGVGIIGRMPIFIRDSLGKAQKERYWGIASTVIDFDTLVHATGIRAMKARLRIALRGTDGNGASGKVFWGDTDLFASDPVIMDIALPSGTWQMAAAPSQGWPRFNPFTSPSVYTGVFLSLFFSILFFQIMRISQSREHEIQRRQTIEAALLQNNIALQRARDELEERVAQRTRELFLAKEAAESADRLKSAFLATMSHELRTPLNSIIGFTGMILQGLVGEISAEQRKQLTMVRDSAHHLLALINDVLDISKIEANQLELHREVYPIQESIDKSIQVVRPLAEKKSLAIASTTDPVPLSVYGDRRRVEQVLINLLTNAVKFTETGGITISAGRSAQPPSSSVASAEAAGDHSMVRISISDTGIGIKPEDMGKLFKPFQQIDIGTTRRYEGTGLGLSICQKLATMLGGAIDVYSGGLGKGSTFTFTLPEGNQKHGDNTDHRGQ